MDFNICIELLLNYLNNTLILPDESFSKEDFDNRLYSRWAIIELITMYENTIEECYTWQEVLNDFRSRMDALASINADGQVIFMKALEEADNAQNLFDDWRDYYNNLNKKIGVS